MSNWETTIATAGNLTKMAGKVVGTLGWGVYVIGKSLFTSSKDDDQKTVQVKGKATNAVSRLTHSHP